MNRPKNPPKPPTRSGKAKGGRPTRAEALRRRIEAVQIDPDAIDPLQILAALAIDQTASASARVAACRTLIAYSGRLIPLTPREQDEDDEPKPRDLLTERALQLMASREGIQ